MFNISSVVLYNRLLMSPFSDKLVDVLRQVFPIPASKLASIRRQIQIFVKDKLSATKPPTQHNPRLDQPFDGNSFNSFHLLCFHKFSIKILSLMFI